MAYRRKHSMTRSSTFVDYRSGASEDQQPSSPSSLAAQAIRASSAHRDSSLSSAYGESAFSSAYRDPNRQRPSQDSTAYEYTSLKSLNESKYGFWGVLARKAKAILEDENVARQFEDSGRNQPHQLDTSPGSQIQESYQSPESYRRTESPIFQKRSEALAYIGDTIKNAFEEGLTIVENRTADIIQETRKLQIRRKSSAANSQNQDSDIPDPQTLSQIQNDHETQLKASRDVANAMAAKAKLLLRELKTVKADLAFAKERCTQLEEENKILRESRQKGSNSEDDDLIRLQLETLLAEKGRLANENSVYARENRFLREIVDYHQLTMQDVVYLDEGNEEVTEVSPLQLPYQSPSRSAKQASPAISSPSSPKSRATTPPPDLVVPQVSQVSPAPLSTVGEETRTADSDSSSSSSPTANNGARQQHAKTPPPSTAEGTTQPRESPTPS